MTDLEKVELAIRLVIAKMEENSEAEKTVSFWFNILADEIALMQ